MTLVSDQVPDPTKLEPHNLIARLGDQFDLNAAEGLSQLDSWFKTLFPALFKDASDDTCPYVFCMKRYQKLTIVSLQSNEGHQFGANELKPYRT